MGINLTESTTLASFRMGALNVLGPDVPRCTGSFKRINVVMREGAIVGKPKFPAATSAATSNICHMTGGLAHSLFAELSEKHGAAFASIGQPGSCPVVSGVDPRKEHKPFVNQMLIGYFGGPATAGSDGWLTYHSYSSQGMGWQPSIEISEQQQPVLVEKLAIRPDSGGAGKYQGGPGSLVTFLAHKTPLRMVITGGAHDNPPPGAGGGKAGAPSRIWKEDAAGNRTDLGIVVDVSLNVGERLVSEACGGGGFGNPAERDKDRVLHQLREGWISPQYAREHYGVELTA
jgi:N-methylhydantoinase B